MTPHEKIIKILSNEDLTMRFFDILGEELNTDEESPDTKFRQLSGMYESNYEFVNDILIDICGWSMDSLMDMTLK